MQMQKGIEILNYKMQKKGITQQCRCKLSQLSWTTILCRVQDHSAMLYNNSGQRSIRSGSKSTPRSTSIALQSASMGSKDLEQDMGET